MRRAGTQRSPAEEQTPNELLVAIMTKAGTDYEQIEQGTKCEFSGKNSRIFDEFSI